VNCVTAYPATTRRRGWSKDELVHFYRAVSALREAGLTVEIDGGVTDEGEPWLVFCDADSGEVLAHFARISGKYIACASFLNGSLTARAFPDLVARFIDRCPSKRVVSFESHSNTGRVAALNPGSVSSLLQMRSVMTARRTTQKAQLT
jgi:hypothetical protein